MKKKTAFILLALILLLGSFLRLFKLGEESFWLDESATVYAANQSASYIVGNIYNKRVLVPEYFKDGGGEMPAYFLLSYYWTRLVGLDEFKMRLLPAIFGIISILMIYILGKEIFNKEVALIAAFILAINHQNINYSQEARMYSLLVLLAISSTYFLARALKGKNKYWTFYVISAALMLYTHYLTFFIIGFHAVFILIYIKTYIKLLKKIFLAYLAIFLIYLPWIPTFIKQFYESAPNSQFFGKPTFFSLSEVFVGFNSWVSPDWGTRLALRAMNFQILPASGWLLIICILSLAFILGVSFVAGVVKKFSFKDSNRILLILWFAVPFIAPFLISVSYPEHSIFKSVKYVLFASPAYYILAAKGIYNLRKYSKAIIILIAILSIAPLYSYYANPDKESWRELGAYLNENRITDEVVMVNGPGNFLPLIYYYSNLDNIKGVRNLEQAKEAVNDENNVWLVYAMEKFYDPNETIKKYLDSDYYLAKKEEFVGIRVFQYRKQNG